MKRLTALVFCLGLLSGAGCNTIIQGANGFGKDMQKGGKALEAVTSKKGDIGAVAIPDGFSDSMLLDKEGFAL